ncbi:hypothetical protein I4U23_007131 [Adineta vaga]|nr:hypothetical protein I4U23_007131 [Adineta vaga]
MISVDVFFSIVTIIFIIFTLITLSFSSITIFTILSHWNSQFRSITYLLICNSCFTLLYYTVTVIIQILFLSKTNYPSFFCQFRAALYFSSCVSSALSYLIQAISRYFITILYKHRILLTFHINSVLIILSWIISFILPALMFISPVAYQYEYESRMCILTTKVFHTSFPAVIIVFVIPLNIIIILYILILRQSSQHNHTFPDTFTRLRMKRNLKVFRNILISIIILTIGGTPFFLCIIFNEIVDIPWQLHSLSLLFISFSATLNSLALFFINNPIRKLFFKKINCQQNANRTRTIQIGQVLSESMQMSPILG